MHRKSSPGSFAEIFPRLARLLQAPVAVSVGLCLLAGVFACFSRNLAIAVSSFWYFYLCAKIERKHLEQLILPPLVLLGFQQLMSVGIGMPLTLYGIQSYGTNDPQLNAAIWSAQVSQAIGFFFLIVGYWISGRNCPAFRFPGRLDANPAATASILYIIGWLLFIANFIYSAAGITTGFTDRSRIPEFLNKGFGIWSWFVLFPRLNGMFFIFAPFLFKKSRSLGRKFIIISLAVIFSFNFLSGSRSAVLTTVCLLFIGWWLFCLHSKRVVRYGMLFAAFAVPYVPLVAIYRSTAAFNNAKQIDAVHRLAAVGEVWSSVTIGNLASLMQLAGESFNGLNDRDIFMRTPDPLPYVGWQNISRLENFWLPSLLAPQKKTLWDGNDIVRLYRADDSVAGADISFSADMYRRFGWPGIPLGNLLLGLFLGCFFSWVFRLYRRQPVIGFLLLVYFLTYFPAVPFLTLLETFWLWFWELPKHLLVLLFFSAFARACFPRWKGPAPATSRSLKTSGLPAGRAFHGKE